MAEIVRTFGGGKQRQRRGHRGPQVFHRTPPRCAEERFQFREPEFDRIQVGAIWRQVPELRARRLDPRADALDVMGGQVIHHDDVADVERRDEDLVKVGEKAVPVHRPIEQPGRGQAGDPQRPHERAGLPVMMRRVIVHARAAPAPAVAPEEVRRDATFIEKREAGGVNRRGDASPVGPRGGDVGAILFGRAHRFF